MHAPSFQLSRRGLGGLALGVAAGLLVGCSSGDPTDAELLEWLSGLSGVDKVEYVPNDEDTTGHSARITTTPDLPDAAVLALMREVGKDYDDHAPRGRPSLQLQIDRVLCDGRTGPVGDRDLSLDRALWLRGDERVISADGLSDRFAILAKPGAVGDVALGFDAVPGEKGRATQEVRSQDGWTAVSWMESARMGWQLDRPLIQRIADLNQRYPGLEWWAQAQPSETKAGLFFASEDIGFAELVSDRKRLVGPGDFATLDLGWGPARAPYALFASAFSTGKIRAVLDAVVDLPGVAELRARDRPGGGPELEGLVARTAQGYLAGLKAVRANWDDFMTVSVVREPARFIGQRPQEVFRGTIFDSAPKVRAQASLAELDQVPQFAIGTSFANLTLTPAIDDEQLTTALTVFTGLLDGGPDPELGSDQPYAINVYYRADDNVQPVGKATAGTFTRSTKTTPVGSELAGRTQTIWERLT